MEHYVRTYVREVPSGRVEVRKRWEMEEEEDEMANEIETCLRC